MKISNRVKRNIQMILTIVGLGCTAARIWDVVVGPSSRHAWFELVGIVVITYLCFDSYLIYRRRVKNGIEYGSK